MKLKTCLVRAEGSTYPFHVLEELENGCLLALRPQDSSLIFFGDLPLEERLSRLENGLVGIDPHEQCFMTYWQTRQALGSAKSLLLRMIV